MYPLKPDDLQRIFDELDKNGDGLVSVDELKTLFERIGVHFSLEELQTLVGRTCLDSIDFFFFYDIIIKTNNGNERKQPSGGGGGGGGSGASNFEGDLVQAFKVFDLNGDGFIASDELQSVLSRLGLWDENGGIDCKSMIKMYDSNCDGKLDFEEFKNMMFPSNS